MKSQNGARPKPMMSARLAASVVLIVLGLLSEVVVRSTHFQGAAVSNASGGSQNPERRNTGGGIIAGVVVNERREPVALARVHAFSVRTAIAQVQAHKTVPFSARASEFSSTDSEGRFQISGLGLGEYLVAAEPGVTLRTPYDSTEPLYATTFYPSTIDYQLAAPVSVIASGTAPIEIELVRVKGVRVSGSARSSSGRPTGGLDVRLFHQFGAVSGEFPVAVLSARGTFEIPHVPPGWYRLTIAPRRTDKNDDAGEFATKLIEVQDSDIADLSFVLGRGASISGRVVAEAGSTIPSGVGLRVSATREQYSPPATISATVAHDFSFRMTGLSGLYQFGASADREPFVEPTRIAVDSVEVAASAGVELTDGTHEVVVFVKQRETATPAIDRSLSSATLVEQFKREKVFWRQFPIAKEIVDRHDASVLPSVVDWLSHEDRHIRGNVAFIFGGFGDPRGLQVITDILTDRSDRPHPGVGAGDRTLQGQIRQDRYYAVHLLGELRDPRAIPTLIPLLKDADLNYKVPWALEQIGDKGAIGPLLDVLDDESPSMRVLAIYALETLNAREALPRLILLLDDHRTSNCGSQVSVADAARAAIAKLQ